MALYLNGSKVKVKMNNINYTMDVFTEIPVTSGEPVMSSDDTYLKDSKGRYITTRKDGE